MKGRDRLRELTDLVDQAKHAETSVGGRLKVRYTSLRRIDAAMLEANAGAFNTFAVSIDVDGQTKDVIYARTPELAKFLAMLINVGSELVSDVLASVKK